MSNLNNNSFKSVFEPRIPLMSPSKFAAEVGVSPSTVCGWMDRGLLPVITLHKSEEGKRPKRFVNISKLFDLCQISPSPQKVGSLQSGA